MVRETGGSSPASRMCLASPPVPRRLCSAWRHPAVFVREEQLRLARLEKHGPKGEPLSQDQVLLLDLQPGVQAVEVAKEAPCQESQEILDLIAKLYAVESERLALVLKIIQTGTVWLPSDNLCCGAGTRRMDQATGAPPPLETMAETESAAAQPHQTRDHPPGGAPRQPQPQSVLAHESKEPRALRPQ